MRDCVTASAVVGVIGLGLRALLVVGGLVSHFSCKWHQSQMLFEKSIQMLDLKMGIFRRQNAPFDQRQLFIPFNDNYFSRCLISNVTWKCKPKAGHSGFGLPAPSVMRGRSNPPCFMQIDFLPAEAC